MVLLMLGPPKARRDGRPVRASLEALVPPDHFYRHLARVLDLGFVRELVRDRYATSGRPSLDPMTSFKLQLVLCFEGLRSERQLIATASLHLAHRWYLGYALDEPLPDPSTLSKLRQRLGVAVFRRFFDHVVEMCQEAGLVWGRELFFDATRVRANAAVPRLGRVVGVSRTDPDATLMRLAGGGPTGLGYQTHYLVDGGRARIILHALTTPGDVWENQPFLDQLQRVRFRWKVRPERAVGDSKCGTVENILAHEDAGIWASFPLADTAHRDSPYYPLAAFAYDAARVEYRCPQGQPPRRYRVAWEKELVGYVADPAVCNACPAKAAPTPGASGPHVHRSLHAAYLDRVRAYHTTESDKQAMRKRGVWVEPLFGEAKQWHGLHQLRLRGLPKVATESLLAAAGQNLKRWLAATGWGRRHAPCGAPTAPGRARRPTRRWRPCWPAP